ncbi:VPS10 [Candida pseudojiufengensis]|uniref:VPS10 n=1 Tax=Candida pseudojiufengensis TaxID=497109 RepID=UPI002225398D|nr:VPS10 [Candida pseudojiufengensis]KAI5962248.1 VPS10 [Candida pseudojiufengensis]
MMFPFCSLLLLLLSYISSSLSFSPEISISIHDDFPEIVRYFDDSSNILTLKNKKAYISYDDGKSFEQVKGIEEKVVQFEFDPFVKERAFIITATNNHYVTRDKGKNWSKFVSNIYEYNEDGLASIPKMEFNAKNPEMLLISNYQCPDSGEYNHKCQHIFHYTTDGFKSKSQKLPLNAHVCRFARSSKNSEIGDESTIYCSENQLNSHKHIVSSNLYRSEDFFKNKKEIKLSETGNGAIIDIKVEESFMTIVSRLDKYSEHSKINLYVTRNGDDFNKADIQIDIKYGVMTFLESSPSSLFLSAIDYSQDKSKISKLYSSDSLGLRFKEILSKLSYVMKIQYIDGAWLANVEVEVEDDDDEQKSLYDYLFGGNAANALISKISIDDGENWQLLKSNDDRCKIEDGCSVHLWTYGQLGGEGKFETGPTPGILMGVGSEGKHLARNYDQMKTYVSRDGGLSWDLALENACVTSSGDKGNILMAVPYNSVAKHGPVDYFYYSLDQGKIWDKVSLEKEIFVIDILTTIDGTSKKFVIDGYAPNSRGQPKEIMYYIDFDGAFDGKTCTDSDFEEVYARQNGDDTPTCVYGHKEKFRRRKQDAKCFVNQLFQDVRVYEDPCQCTEKDFECSLGFKPSDKGDACVPDPKMITSICKESGKNQIEIFDKSKISGNLCDFGSKKIEDFASKETFKCSDYTKPNDDNSGEKTDIVVSKNEVEGLITQYVYVNTDADAKIADNIVLKTNEERVYVSNDGGTGFTRVPVHDKILAFYTGLVPGQVILVTDSTTFYYSIDGGGMFRKFKAPNKPVASSPSQVSFHKTDERKFIWMGGDCERNDRNCEASAYFTTTGGESFKKIMDNIIMCDYVGPVFEKRIDNLIYCSVKEENGKKSLYSIDGSKKPDKIFDDIVGYAITGHYVVVAIIKDDSLEAKVTVDGTTFADADFPKDLKVGKHQAYTVLDSSSNSIFMQVETNLEQGFEYGSLLKSNLNGTYFVLSLEHVNRNSVGYVDFDRIDNLEGTIVANVVANYKDKKGTKKLQTLISRNDGSEWDFLAPPVVNSKGDKYQCIGQPRSKCALHLHGFTERADYRDTYSSGSAVGFLMGVGNVGEYLTDLDSSSTFLSIDGGITWKEVKDGVYQWEYGDQGTILTLVDAVKETDTLIYSLDEGKSWNDYKFTDTPVKILDLTTVPTDTSRKFLILAAHPKERRDTLTFSIDFTNIYSRQCQLDLDKPNQDDFEYWSPYHPEGEDKCLFGHESMYLRRAINHNDCFIGSAPLNEGYKRTRNCSCTRRDYECDYNYQRDITDNTCKLVPGLTAEDRKKDMCSKPNAFQYFESTGYRKIPLSTCEGGKQFDSFSPKPCPGKSKEFDEYYGREVKGSKLFIVLFVPLLVFIFATWFVYDRGIKRNGGFVRLGQIRLDEDGEDGFNPIENNQVDVIVNKIVKGGIFTAAVIIASFKTIRKIDKLLIDKIGNNIFKRPGRRNYVSIPEEDDELFGDFDENDDIDDELTNGVRFSQDFFRDNNHEENEDARSFKESDLVDFNGDKSNKNNDPTSTNESLFNIDDDDDDDEEENENPPKK